MGKKRKGPGRKKLRAYVCVFMCALMLFQSAEPSSGAIAAPPGDALNEQDYLEPDINDEAEKDENDVAHSDSDSESLNDEKSGVSIYAADISNDDNDIVSAHAASESINVIPHINMPYVAYEGHTVLLSDASEYTVDGKRVEMKDLYDDGSVRLEFNVTDNEKSGSVSIRRGKCERYQRNAVFSKPGSYELEMRIYVRDDYIYAKKQRISIDKAPETISVTGGAKKQNRLQRIEFKTAQNPLYPVESLELEISADKGSEKILVNLLENKNGKVSKSAHIITRDLSCSVDEEKCFVSGSIEFMSMFEYDTDLSYKITAVDSRKNKHTFQDDLTIYTDKAPVAAIDMSEKYTREEKSRYAVVTAEDVSQTDGDSLEREWFVKYEGDSAFRPIEKEPGYTDLSDGSAARISFRKNGTGVFYVKLIVHDVWTEGTMDEYTASMRRLSDETEKKCEVINIAPHVSVGAHSLKKADIIVISDKDEDEKDIKERFFEKFMSAGTEADISFENADMSRVSSSGADIEECFSHRGDYGYNGASTSFECDLYAVDNSNMYCMDAVWSDPDKGRPEEPFTLTAFNAENGKEVWSYLITSDLFKMNVSRAFMYQDDSEKYLYIVSSGKTLVMSKKSGVPVTVIDYELGEYNYVGDDIIYTYCDNGIFGISLRDGSVSKVWKGRVSGASRRVSGLVNSYYRTPQGSIMKLMLDTGSGEISEKYIGKLDSKLFREAGKKVNSDLVLDVAGIDVDGTALIHVDAALYNDNINSSLYNYKTVIQIYNGDDRMLKQEVRTNSYRMKVFPVINNIGKYNYAAISYDGHDEVEVEVFGADLTYNSKVRISNKNGDPAVYDQIIYSIENGGKINITVGGLCTWIYNQTWGNGPSHGYPERCTNLTFDLQSGAASKGSLLAGCSSFSEYARRSDIYTVIHTGRNSQYVGTASLDNNIVKHPCTAYEIFYRVMMKNVKYGSGTDHKIMLIKNDEMIDSLSADEKNMLMEKISKAGYIVYILGNYNGNDTDTVKYISEKDDYITEIVRSVSENKIDQKGYSSVNVKSDNGFIEREIQLDDNKEYYYEYTVRSDSENKNITDISHGTLPVLPEKTYDKESFSVYDYEIEDFDDDSLNSFFSIRDYTYAGGLYTDCYASYTGKSNVGVDHTSVISFDIPAGKQGVISFDYIIVNNKSAGKINSNYVEIDGVRWEETPGITGNGTYTHPYILGSGKHEIKLYTGGYGGKMITYTYIDDLKLSYIKKGSAEINIISEENVSNKTGNVYKVSGSFKTPGNVTSYREMKNVSYLRGEPGEVDNTERVKEDDYDDLYIKIPAGKKAVGSTVKLNSYTKAKYSVSYSMDEFTGCSHYGTLQTFNFALSHIPAEWIYSIPVFSGERHFRSSFNSYRGTWGNFSDVQMYIVDDTNLLINKHNFLKASAGSEKTLFLGENMYSGKTAFRLKLDKNISRIYDFAIYTIQDGRKIYIASDDFSDVGTYGKWKQDGVSLEHDAENSDENDEIKIFQKGQFIKYDINYWDYEDDPSKQSFWKYTHTPSNDGEFENAAVILDKDGNITSESGIILNEPVTRFYKDGKYTVEHWQIDDTTGGAEDGGDPGYDRESNHVFLTFYIGGIADAPWIRYIKTVPSQLYEGEPVGLEIAVDDALKQQLTLEASIYLDEDIIEHKKISDINASNGKYENITINNIIPAAACGRYKAVCIVTSRSGTGTDSIIFNVVSRGNIEGTVYHTDKWEENRKYAGREHDVFWPGERIMLKADVEGLPAQVTAWIEGEEDKEYKLEPAEQGIYRGSIWSEDMMLRWGSSITDKKIIFCAKYSGGNDKISEYSITFDNRRLYWNIHRIQGS